MFASHRISPLRRADYFQDFHTLWLHFNITGNSSSSNSIYPAQFAICRAKPRICIRPAVYVLRIGGECVTKVCKSFEKPVYLLVRRPLCFLAGSSIRSCVTDKGMWQQQVDPAQQLMRFLCTIYFAANVPIKSSGASIHAIWPSYWGGEGVLLCG